MRCQRHPARTDIFTDSHTAQSSEDTLVIERRQSSLTGNILNVQFFRQILFYEIYGFLNSFKCI